MLMLSSSKILNNTVVVMVMVSIIAMGEHLEQNKVSFFLFTPICNFFFSSFFFIVGSVIL